MATPQKPDLSLISIRELMRMVNVKSRQTVYERLRHDPLFPKPRRIGTRSIGGRRPEVEAWLTILPVAQFDGLGAVDRTAQTDERRAA
jgi:predicted DNA-binding transcriptional regulator AlpA